MRIFRDPREARSASRELRRRGARLGFVPTMGALHKGHLGLLDACRAAGADETWASVFLNPTQFAEGEDLAEYPRDEAEDFAALEASGAAATFAPSAETMYPSGFSAAIDVGGAAKAGLEDQFRPHFFGGVAMAVTKLLAIVECDLAAFGEKDWQQLQVVKRLVADLNLGVEIVAAPTAREPDGLAMSSRNAYLDAEARNVAPRLHQTLLDVRERLERGDDVAASLSDGEETLKSHGFAVDYLSLRRAEDLAPTFEAEDSLRLLSAARLGAVRLIDNLKATLPKRT